ncbi:hypothetical protein BUPH_08135 [Paraburkholderia phenoliruptrix BR3459a]|uniref:Uncharacterized protein n=1 Tax=Paraburkholderia phenoliruptrix BR3459a TaxID=1229205 RepID=K0DNP6_9BURK|nr:hypothetical protein BUPH_08135 [Paraburkholderia phenoliruptrix BR3459a]
MENPDPSSDHGLPISQSENDGGIMKKKRNDPKRNDGIVSWHASSGPQVTKSPTKPLRTPLVERGGSPKPETQPTMVESIFRCDLRPTAGQRATLDSLFSGPQFLKKLLLSAEEKPRTPHDASMFLLRHHRELQPYLFAGNRSESIDLLKGLIVQWGSRVPKLIELQFSGDCSISASNEIFFPIPRLGKLPIQNPGRLADARQGSRYNPAFALVHSSLGYLVEIVFTRPSSIGRALDVPKAREQKSSKSAPAKVAPARAIDDRLSFDKFVLLFDDAVNQRLLSEIRIAQRYATPDFNALEGRQVLGGLPSLGKRR